MKSQGVGNAAKPNLTWNCVKIKQIDLWELSQIEFSVHMECLSMRVAVDLGQLIRAVVAGRGVQRLQKLPRWWPLFS